MLEGGAISSPTWSSLRPIIFIYCKPENNDGGLSSLRSATNNQIAALLSKNAMMSAFVAPTVDRIVDFRYRWLSFFVFFTALFNTARRYLSMTSSVCRILLLARYVPNVAKRSTWHQCTCIDERRPTTDRRPTSRRGKFRMAIFLQRVVRSTSCLVLG